MNMALEHALNSVLLHICQSYCFNGAFMTRLVLDLLRIRLVVSYFVVVDMQCFECEASDCTDECMGV